jgi:RNA polymerase-binding transcription factor DksA
MRTSTRLAAVREQLLALANQAEEVRSELATEAANGDAGEADPYRLADVHRRATEEVVTTQLLGLETGVEREARAAIERIDQGTYGLCERCGLRIPKGRLEVIPYARTCVKCAG